MGARPFSEHLSLDRSDLPPFKGEPKGFGGGPEKGSA